MPERHLVPVPSHPTATESSASDHDWSREEPLSDIREILMPPKVPCVAEGVSAARALVEALVTAGVDTFFGIPGGPIAAVFDALSEVPGARLVESRQETGAAFAAAGFYRATGRVPAIVVTAGPGATQAVTGIVNASLERVPMIVVVGDVSWAASGARVLQDTGPEGIAIEEMLAKATRAQVRIARAESAASQALAALDAALDPERPGPALVVLPMQHASGIVRPTRTTRRRRERSIDVDAESLREACRTLTSARRPLLVLGAGCRPHAAEIRRLTDTLDIPFVTTPAAKGVVSEEHPRSLRSGGLAASSWAREYTREGVDGCVVLGTDLDDVSIGPTRYVAPGGTLIHVDLDARVFHRNLPTTLGVVADLEIFALRMREEWTHEGHHHGAIGRVVRALKAEVSPYDRSLVASRDAIGPHEAVLEIERALPEARFVTDIGEHMLFALHYLTAKGPDAFHIQLGLGSMGSGIASAVGLALGDPDRPVVCIAGDGCMQMMGSEVLVAVQERLPIVFLVFNDARYNMVHHGMKQLYGRARAWESPRIDFAKWGEAYGLRTMRADRAGDLARSRVAALRSGGGPVLIDARIDRDVRLRGAGRVEALQQMGGHDVGGAR